MMELEAIKTSWQLKEPVSYSEEELESIYNIKKSNVLGELKIAFSVDLIIAISLASVFIFALQVLNYASSDFWSVCMAILVIQHLVFYLYQSVMIKKYQAFEDNVLHSIRNHIKKLKVLLWFYRMWPAILALVLYIYYIIRFTPDWTLSIIVVSGSSITITAGILSNYVSAVMIRRQIMRLGAVLEEYERY